MVKQILKNSKAFQAFIYYFKKTLNGDIGYISFRKTQSRAFIGGIIIDLEMNKSFTSASALKNHFFSQYMQENMKICTSKERKLANFEINSDSKEKTGISFEEDEMITEKIIDKGDFFIHKENNKALLSLALRKIEDNEKKIIKVGRIINLHGYYLMDEFASPKNRDKEEFNIEDFCTLRKRILIKVLKIYVFFSVLLFLHVHFYLKDVVFYPLFIKFDLLDT